MSTKLNGHNDYNQIYEMLVDGPEDILGLVAYGLYKLDKVKYIKEFCEQSGGTRPSEEDMLAFRQDSYKKTKEYCQKAEAIFEEATNTTLQLTLDEAKEDYDEELKDRLQSDTSIRLEERIEKKLMAKVEKIEEKKQEIIDKYDSALTDKLKKSFSDGVKGSILVSVIIIFLIGAGYLISIGTSHSWKEAYLVLTGKAKVVCEPNENYKGVAPTPRSIE